VAFLGGSLPKIRLGVFGPWWQSYILLNFFDPIGPGSAHSSRSNQFRAVICRFSAHTDKIVPNLFHVKG
jgi:hypothetical protein